MTANHADPRPQRSGKECAAGQIRADLLQWLEDGRVVRNDEVSSQCLRLSDQRYRRVKGQQNSTDPASWAANQQAHIVPASSQESRRDSLKDVKKLLNVVHRTKKEAQPIWAAPLGNVWWFARLSENRFLLRTGIREQLEFNKLLRVEWFVYDRDYSLPPDCAGGPTWTRTRDRPVMSRWL